MTSLTRAAAVCGVLAAGLACRAPAPSAGRRLWPAAAAPVRVDVTGLASAPEAGELALTLDDETRAGRVLSAGRTLASEVAVPPGGELRLALAGPAGTRLRADSGTGAVGTCTVSGADRWSECRWVLKRHGLVRLRLSLTAGPHAFVAHPWVHSPHDDRRPNLVLLSVDALRADRVLGDASAAPHLAAWTRAHATWFSNAWTQAPWTLPAHATLLSGRDPLWHGASWPFEPLAADVPLLAERLRAHGYFTAAWTGGGWLEPAWGLARGFERWRAWPAAGRGDEEWRRHAALAQAALSDLPQPFLLLLHTYAVHDFPRAPRLAPGTGDERRRALYDAAVGDFDRSLAPLLAALARPEWRTRTAVVVTADHGEGLGEPSLGGARSYGHGALDEAVLRVPLSLALPSAAAFRPPGRAALVSRTDTQVRLVDVAATLAELAGLPPEAEAAGDPWAGASLLPLLRGGGRPRPALSYYPLGRPSLVLRDGLGAQHACDDAARPAGETGEMSSVPAAPHAALAGEARRLLGERLAGRVLRFERGSPAVADRSRLDDERASTLHAGRGGGISFTPGTPLPAWPVIELDGTGLGRGALRFAPQPRCALTALDDDRVRLACAPGVAATALTLVLVRPVTTLRLQRSDAGVVPAPLVLAPAQAPTAWASTARGWRPLAPHEPCRAALCLRLTERGPRPTATDGPLDAASTARRERLRALGYTEAGPQPR